MNDIFSCSFFQMHSLLWIHATMHVFSLNVYTTCHLLNLFLYIKKQSNGRKENEGYQRAGTGGVRRRVVVGSCTFMGGSFRVQGFFIHDEGRMAWVVLRFSSEVAGGATCMGEVVVVRVGLGSAASIHGCGSFHSFFFMYINTHGGRDWWYGVATDGRSGWEGRTRLRIGWKGGGSELAAWINESLEVRGKEKKEGEEIYTWMLKKGHRSTLKYIPRATNRCQLRV